MLNASKLIPQQVEQTMGFGNVAVFGLGFVGLPLALTFALRGASVIGVDVVKDLVEEISEGRSSLHEAYEGTPINQVISLMVEQRRFQVTTDASTALKYCRSFIVTVGIPVKAGEPDLGPLIAVTRTIASGLKPGDLVLFRSTMVPGTVEGTLIPILAESGLRPGLDFHVAYASERIAEGRAFEEFENMPVVLAGLTAACRERAKQLLETVTRAPVHYGSSIRAVEVTKVVENVQRDVNIAMVQEFARLCEKIDVDIFEVIRLANTHRRVNLLTPGPGVGGYCLPNALHYLLPPAAEFGVSLDLLRTARRINEQMPTIIVNMVESALAQYGKCLEGARVAILGLAMKDYSNDDRQSPPIEVSQLLLERGARLAAFDPAVPTCYSFKASSLEAVLHGADLVLVLALQQGIDYATIRFHKHLLANPKILFDTRNMVTRQQASEDGFEFYGI